MNISTFVLFLLFNLISTPIMADHNSVTFEQLANIFGIKMYNSIVLQKPNENVIFSPFSIQTCAAMGRMGAEHETASELDRALGLDSSDLSAIAYNFHINLVNSPTLKMFNIIYIKETYGFQFDSNDLLNYYFRSTPTSINFDHKTTAANNINSWVESKTKHLIKNLVSSDDIKENTRLMLLNAIHFKAKWITQFDALLTDNEGFYLNRTYTVQVPMMHNKDYFNYETLSELKASAIELPYKDSDLSMIIISPDSRTGLKALEEKLLNIKIADILAKMDNKEVYAIIPSFKTELSIELTEPFKQLGMTRMFTDKAEFGKMLQQEKDLKVSEIKHKINIEVNENGTKAVAATGVKEISSKEEGIKKNGTKNSVKKAGTNTEIEYIDTPRQMISSTRVFFANRPFFYCIVDLRSRINLFMGRVTTF